MILRLPRYQVDGILGAMRAIALAHSSDFWAATEQPLDELRRAYGVPPLDHALAA